MVDIMTGASVARVVGFQKKLGLELQNGVDGRFWGYAQMSIGKGGIVNRRT
jgi:hypothetical protein